MITSKEVQNIARLARIKLTQKEENSFKKDLSSILDYINKLNELNTEKVEPIYQTAGIINSLRPDKHRKDFEMSEELNEKLIGQAPQKEKRFIKVRSVISK